MQRDKELEIPNFTSNRKKITHVFKENPPINRWMRDEHKDFTQTDSVCVCVCRLPIIIGVKFMYDFNFMNCALKQNEHNR